jgi:glycine cleavage system H lipoate-binding protein
MVAIAVILTFAVMVLIDHLILRQPIIIAEEAGHTATPRPRLVPAVVSGFSLPDNLRYHPGHTWAVAESTDLVRVGMDDFAAKVTGDVQSIDLPERGQWVRQGQKVATLHRKDGRNVTIVSPIEGTVVEINEEAARNPLVAKNDPYGDGWLMTVNSPDAKTLFGNLLGGLLARRWMDDAAARHNLRQALFNARLRAFMATPAPALAQDGGMAVDDVLKQIPAADFDKVAREFFLN